MEILRARFSQAYNAALVTENWADLKPLLSTMRQFIQEIEKAWPDEAIQLAFSLQLLEKAKRPKALATYEVKY